jgi:hypothetical protein
VQRAAELSAEEADRKKREAAYLEAGKMVRSTWHSVVLISAKERSSGSNSKQQQQNRQQQKVGGAGRS